jgi:hypothetical protein
LAATCAFADVWEGREGRRAGCTTEGRRTDAAETKGFVVVAGRWRDALVITTSAIRTKLGKQ